MNIPDTPSQLEERLAQLEERLAYLEGLCEASQIEIPWHVICAAVAAVIPDGRVVRVSPVTSRDEWRISGLMKNLHSHRIR